MVSTTFIAVFQCMTPGQDVKLCKFECLNEHGVITFISRK